MKVKYIILILSLCQTLYGQSYTLSSPSKNISILITPGERTEFSVSLNNDIVIQKSYIEFKTETTTSKTWKPGRAKTSTSDKMIFPVVHEKFSMIRDNYNQIDLPFNNGITLSFRAYDNGIAYRWQTYFRDSVIINSEILEIGFDKSDTAWYPSETGFYSHNERTYRRYAIQDLTVDSLASLPVLINHNGVNILLSESDLLDYAGMWVTGNDGSGLRAVFPTFPLEETARGDRDVRVLKTADYISYTNGTRTFPWRAFLISEDDRGLLENTLIYQLASGSESPAGDFSWIKPGKVAWDWWNALNIDGVDFVSGVNTETYKYYIDFASEYGLEYIILDEGWSPTTDITEPVRNIDMPALIKYADGKNVGVILWVLWTSLERQMEEALDLYRQWGIKGIKVDFMQRDDQKMVNFYERTAAEAAERMLLVDFHGAFKPTGLERKYPNVITREGVYGLEQSKWDNAALISPEHNVTLPFIRNVTGAMDYTPGAMLNAQRESWHPVFQRPASLGTRCHQLAMYVVYTSPLQMLADAPSNYYQEPECMEFLSAVPVVWEETVPLKGKTGDYIAVARRSAAGDWYIGVMTDWTARDMEIDLGFLPDGSFSAEIWRDGINASRNANDYKRETIEVAPGTKLNIHLAPGGGWVARVTLKTSIL